MYHLFWSGGYIFIIFFLLVIDRTYKTLSTSYECEHDNPNLALFKYDKNKPQRLSFLGDIDMKTGKREERCIRNFFANSIQVEPTCTDDSVSTEWIYETQFHEVIWNHRCSLQRWKVWCSVVLQAFIVNLFFFNKMGLIYAY